MARFNSKMPQYTLPTLASFPQKSGLESKQWPRFRSRFRLLTIFLGCHKLPIQAQPHFLQFLVSDSFPNINPSETECTWK